LIEENKKTGQNQRKSFIEKKKLNNLYKIKMEGKMEGGGEYRPFEDVGLRLYKNKLSTQEDLTGTKELEEGFVAKKLSDDLIDKASLIIEPKDKLSDLIKAKELDVTEKPSANSNDKTSPFLKSKEILNNPIEKKEPKKKVVVEKPSADLKDKPSSTVELKKVSIENSQSSVETEGELEPELVEKWANHFLTWEVMDEYALGYAKNKKSKEARRTLKKYEKAFVKAEKLKDKLVDKIINAKKLRVNSSDDEIKTEIVRIFKSEFKGSNLGPIINEGKFSKIDEAVVSEENLVNRLEQNTSKEEKKQDFSVEEKPREEVEQIMARELESSVKNLDRTSERVESLESLKSKKDKFFEKYKKGIAYINYLDGSELKLLDYDLKTRKVLVSVYRPFVYDKESNSFSLNDDERRRERKEISLEELEDVMKKSSTKVEMDEADKQAGFEEENTRRFELLGKLCVNAEGERLENVRYLKKLKKDDKIQISNIRFNFTDESGKNKKRKITPKEWEDKFIKEKGFKLYENEEALIKEFKEEFGELRSGKSLRVINFEYSLEKRRYLVKIQEEEKRPRLVTVSNLRELVRTIEKREMENKKEELNELEEKVKSIFEKEMEAYRFGVEVLVKKDIKIREETRVSIIRDYLGDYLKNELPGRIKNKIKEYNISGVNASKITEVLRIKFS